MAMSDARLREIVDALHCHRESAMANEVEELHAEVRRLRAFEVEANEVLQEIRGLLHVKPAHSTIQAVEKLVREKDVRCPRCGTLLDDWVHMDGRAGVEPGEEAMTKEDDMKRQTMKISPLDPTQPCVIQNCKFEWCEDEPAEGLGVVIAAPPDGSSVVDGNDFSGVQEIVDEG